MPRGPSVATIARSTWSPAARWLSSHAAMLLGMLALMLARRAEYEHAGTHHHGSGGGHLTAHADEGP